MTTSAVRLGAAAASVALTLLAGPAFSQGGEAGGPPPPEPADYKLDQYRSPTPATLAGAKAVSAQQAEAMWRDRSAVFIDTMPRDRHPSELPPGTVWRDRPRDNIPGSVWLVNVGYGVLAPDVEAYFRAGLKAAVGDPPGRPTLFYCMTDCWMSWNAAKRAMAWGYRDVTWFPAGADGWQQAGFKLELAKPYEASRSAGVSK